MKYRDGTINDANSAYARLIGELRERDQAFWTSRGYPGKAPQRIRFKAVWRGQAAAIVIPRIEA